MKKMGPYPPYYIANEVGALMMDGRTVLSIIDQAASSPLFIYSREILNQKMSELRRAMPASLAIHYAMKANSYKPVLEHMRDIVDGFDLASGGEMDLALAAGVKAENMSFAGPGKRDSELEKAIIAGVTLNVESPTEAERMIAIADRLGIKAKAALRVNPSFDLKGSGMKMGGGAKQFGMDEDLIAPTARKIIDSGNDWRGFHIYAGSQSLNADAIMETQAQTFDLAARLANEIGKKPPKINLGGGFGIPYFPKEAPLDIAAIGKALDHQLSHLPAILSDTKFCIELGRYLVGEAGLYATKVVDKKISHGETFLVVDGGLHHQLAASGNFGTVIRRNYPIAVARAFKPDGQYDEDKDSLVSVVGCLCTPLDILGDKVLLPEIEVGEAIILFCAGAYGASASPVNFLGHGQAIEILV